MPLPSKRLLYFAGIVLAMGVLVPILPWLVVFWRIVVALLVFLVIADFVLRPKPGSVVLYRETRRVDHVGRPGSFKLHIRNASERPLSVAIHERLPAQLEGDGARNRFRFEPGEEVTHEVAFVGVERGNHKLLPVGVRLAHQLGLLEYQLRFELNDSIRVAPGRPAGETAWLLARASRFDQIGEHKIRRKGLEWEFESLREYVPGDELKRIDWKASSRRHLPMVREYRAERNAQVVFALDTGRLMGGLIHRVRKLDLAMTPLLDLAAVCLQRGDRVGLLAFDSAPKLWLPARGGFRQLNTMIEQLADLTAEDKPTSYLRALAHLESRHKKRSLIILLTDFTDEISAQEVYASLASLSKRHTILMCAVSDPHLEEIFDTQRREESSLFEKAIAGQLLSERRRVMARIERLGVATIDAEPRRLTGPLIRKYLDLRLSRAL